MNSMVSKFKIFLRSPLCFMPAKKILSYLCSFLTVFLICRVLFTCLVTKPTTTYKEEKELTTEDLPEIVVCANPGFKQAVVEKYGYNRGVEYYFGFILILPEQMLPGVSVSHGRTGLLFFPTSNCSKFLPISCNCYGIKEFSSHLNSLIDIDFI